MERRWGGLVKRVLCDRKTCDMRWVWQIVFTQALVGDGRVLQGFGACCDKVALTGQGFYGAIFWRVFSLWL